jgi:tetratricopeptide (TPR) repeat protein
MAPDISENEFKDKGLELFKGLEEKVKLLEKARSAYDEGVKLINEGKDLFNSGKIPESLKKFLEAKFKIEEEISLRIEPLAWRLLWLEFGYLFILLLLGYLTYKWPDWGPWKGLINLHLQTAWFGALGGITAAIYGIYSHVQKMDFDPKYKLWYICKPIIGGIFGWFIYLIYFLGIISAQGMDQAAIRKPELPFIIAFLAGFSERFTIKIIDKLMNVLLSWEEKSKESKPV